MAKKKSSKASGKKVSTFGEALGFNNIFHNERINFVLGFLLLLIAGYLIWAFVSYLVTGAADQSLIETPRDAVVASEPMPRGSSSNAVSDFRHSSSPFSCCCWQST